MFIHLRTHSAYSLLEGAITVKDIVALAQKHAMPAIAVTDTRNMFGTLEFAITAMANGIQPIIGCILPLGKKSLHADKQETAEIVLLAQNEIGYRNLMHIMTFHLFIEFTVV